MIQYTLTIREDVNHVNVEFRQSDHWQPTQAEIGYLALAFSHIAHLDCDLVREIKKELAPSEAPVW